MRGLEPLKTWQLELRQSLLMQSKSPGFTLLLVVTLAFGIGASTAIFSGINVIFFKQLPGAREPERLCHIKIGTGAGRVYYSDYVDFQERNRTLTGMAAYTKQHSKWRFYGQRHQLNGEMISGNYFQALGVAAQLGRILTPEDEVAGAGNAVVLSDTTWRKHFAADPGVVGKQVTIDNQGFTIAGVVQPDFQGAQPPSAAGYWIMLKKAAELKLFDGSLEERGKRGIRSLSLIGRIKPGSDIHQVKAELELIFNQFKQLQPELYRDRFLSVEPVVRGIRLPDGSSNPLYTPITITIVVVSLMLLITCANVASFLLARGMGRRREIAVRLALGASRWRIVRMLLTESLLLALLGGAMAAPLTLWLTDLMSYALNLLYKTLKPETETLLWNFSPDWNVFGAALLISLLVGILSGMVPALQASKCNLVGELKGEIFLLAPRFRRLNWQNLLVVSQVVGSVVLLTGAGLFLRSVQQASQIDLGYGSHNVFFNQIWIDKKRYSLTQANEFFLDLQTRIATLPEVQSVCLTEGPLLDDARYSGGQTITVYGTEQKPFGDRKIESFIVSPKFFETVGIPLAGGRDFTEQDRLTSGRVIVINEALARRAFPERNPIGQQLRLFPDMLYPNSEPLEIIGVAKDAKHHSLSEGTEPYLYRPIKDFYGYRGNYMGLFIRTHRNPATTLQAVAGLINNLDPEVTFKQSTIADNINRITLPSRIASAYIGLFGVLGLILVSVGLSGVLANTVARRTKEIGVRMALGASRYDTLRMIIGEGLALALAGVILGLLLSLALTRALTGILYGVSYADPLAYSGTTFILVLVAFVACYLPARRAAKVDPIVALRHE